MKIVLKFCGNFVEILTTSQNTHTHAVKKYIEKIHLWSLQVNVKPKTPRHFIV